MSEHTDKALERYDAMDAQDRMELEELQAERKHSPLPWTYEFGRGVWRQQRMECHANILDSTGANVDATEYSTDGEIVVGNAALIVEAVNAYDALIAYHRASDAYRRYCQDTLLGEVSPDRANALRKEIMVAYRAIPAVTREKLEKESDNA